MFHYVTNQEFLSAMKEDCSDLINQLVQRINNEGYMEVRAELVGSGMRGLITQNAQDPIDLDYNLILLSFKRPYPNGQPCRHPHKLVGTSNQAICPETVQFYPSKK